MSDANTIIKTTLISSIIISVYVLNNHLFDYVFNPDYSPVKYAAYSTLFCFFMTSLQISIFQFRQEIMTKLFNKLTTKKNHVEQSQEQSNETVSVIKLKEPVIWDANLSDAELGNISFEIYLDGQKGNQLLNGHDFLDWLSMYGVSPSSVEACQIEIGVSTDVPEGTVRFERQDR